MPPTFTDEGIQAALRIRERRPDQAIVVLSQYVEERYAADLLADQGAGIGYLAWGSRHRIALGIKAIRQARGVRQQLLHGHLTLNWLEFTICIEHLEVFQFRNKL